ncbi:TatD family hydrolase [soil metagenome]
MNELFDTHCHIQSIGQNIGERSTRELWTKADGLTIDTVVSQANQAGVQQMICVGCELPDSKLAIECAANRDGLYASIGIHPHEAQHYAGQKGLLDEFAALAKQPKVVAVGETGLDYFYEHSPKQAQIVILKFQIELAIQHDLAMIFHVREAFNDFWPIFESYPAGSIRGVIHSFTDSAENMKRAIDHGLYIGVNGIATFAKEEEKTVMYRTIPLDSLLLETDSPFLTPSPYRGSINEPKHIRTIAEFLETIRGHGQQKLAEATTKNAKALFRV